MILQRHRVNAFRIERRDDGFLSDVAECRNLGPLIVRQRMFATA